MCEGCWATSVISHTVDCVQHRPEMRCSVSHSSRMPGISHTVDALPDVQHRGRLRDSVYPLLRMHPSATELTRTATSDRIDRGEGDEDRVV